MYYIAPKMLIFAMVILGWILVVPAFFAPKKYSEVMGKIMKNPDLVRIASLWILLVGFIYLSNYWKLDRTRNIVISLIGWLSILKGIIGLWFPIYSYKKYQRFLNTTLGIYVLSISAFVLLVFLSWVAVVKF